MGWYLRKSVKIGPVRFNLSKSGIGTSVGVKGFRVGVRPNGKSYVHAGRYGLYYRQELGDGSINDNVQEKQPISEYVLPEENITKYETASPQNLTSKSRQELLEKLNDSYKAVRLDLISAIVLSLITITLFSLIAISGAISALTSIVFFILVARWETKRRTVHLFYDFEDEKGEFFKKIIEAFNNLASNSKVWALIDSRHLYDAHESKRNAGASNLINRSDVQIGEGKPPWVEVNIDVPVLKARNQTLYMLPDGILVYGNNGVGFVEYEELKIETNTTRFIEENPPRDANIIDRTWKYPNKKGGPDRRFSNNYEIPICLYGELKIQSAKGMFFYLMTSKNDSPEKFELQLQKTLK